MRWQRKPAISWRCESRPESEQVNQATEITELFERKLKISVGSVAKPMEFKYFSGILPLDAFLSLA
jgi:hypothetical protein